MVFESALGFGGKRKADEDERRVTALDTPIYIVMPSVHRSAWRPLVVIPYRVAGFTSAEETPVGRACRGIADAYTRGRGNRSRQSARQMQGDRHGA